MISKATIAVMKTVSLCVQLAAVIVAILAVGCSTTQSDGQIRPKKADTFDGVVRPPKEQIDVFMDGQMPARRYKVIKILSEKGGMGREAKMADGFVRKAKALGADGIIINQARGGGVDVGPFGANSISSYTATVFVYE